MVFDVTVLHHVEDLTDNVLVVIITSGFHAALLDFQLVWLEFILSSKCLSHIATHSEISRSSFL